MTETLSVEPLAANGLLAETTPEPARMRDTLPRRESHQRQVFRNQKALQDYMNTWQNAIDIPDNFDPLVLDETTGATELNFKINVKYFDIHIRVDTDRKELEAWAQRGPIKGGGIKIGPNGGTQRIGFAVFGFKLYADIQVLWNPSFKVQITGAAKAPFTPEYNFKWSYPQ